MRIIVIYIMVALCILIQAGCNNNTDEWIVGSSSSVNNNDKLDYHNARAVFVEFLRAWIDNDIDRAYSMLHPKCQFSDASKRRAYLKIARWRRQYGIIYEIYQNSKEMSSVRCGRNMSDRDRLIIRSHDDFKRRISSIMASIQLIRKEYQREDIIKLLYYLTNGNNILDKDINQRLWPDRVVFMSYRLAKTGKPNVMVLVKDGDRWYPADMPGEPDALFDGSQNLTFTPVRLKQ